jgi:hypothetical protein
MFANNVILQTVLSATMRDCVLCAVLDSFLTAYHAKTVPQLCPCAKSVAMGHRVTNV